MKKKDRICPLRLQAFETNTLASHDTKLQLCKCLKNKCEWYDDEYQECIIRAISTL